MVKIGDPGALKGGAGVEQFYANIYSKLAPFKYNIFWCNNYVDIRIKTMGNNKRLAL